MARLEPRPGPNKSHHIPSPNLATTTFPHTTPVLENMAPDEGAIQNAVNDVLDGVSFRQAALRHGVNRQTVANRILGMESRQEAHASEQRRTPDHAPSLLH